jgi:hypothetical protein
VWKFYFAYNIDVLELSPKQIRILERIAEHGFAIVAFPLYASAAGVRKGNCAVLLTPIPNGGMRLLGDPCWLVNGNLSVRVRKNNDEWFVCKKQEIQVTPERLAEVAEFRRKLEDLLAAKA